MNDEINETSINARAQRPRSPRVPVNFAVQIEGATRDGKAFKAQATAMRVSRGGATLACDGDFTIGARLRITPPFGSPLDAEVNGIWTDAEDGQQRVGVKLLDPHGWFAE
jgi:hypothetical protein